MNPKMHSHEFKKAVLLVYDYLGSMRKAEAAMRVWREGLVALA